MRPLPSPLPRDLQRLSALPIPHTAAAETNPLANNNHDSHYRFNTQCGVPMVSPPDLPHAEDEVRSNRARSVARGRQDGGLCWMSAKANFDDEFRAHVYRPSIARELEFGAGRSASATSRRSSP